MPSSDIEKLRHMIANIEHRKKVKTPQIFRRKDHNLTPPTYIQTNEFTMPFQEITDTYGVPNYKEVNPSYFGIVTFPFLFGVMFGDIGHGTLFFLFGVFLCLQQKFLNLTAVRPFLPYRYLILMMGFFAMYCGWCYNDMASIPVEKFET